MITKEDLLGAGYMITTQPLKVRPAGLYLKGEFSFGDADGDKTCYMTIESFEELEAIKRYLSWKDKMGYNEEINYRQRRDYDKMENDFYAQAGQEWEEKYLWDGVQDWWPNDPTAGDIPAHLQETSLLFSDGEHEWEVK